VLTRQRGGQATETAGRAATRGTVRELSLGRTGMLRQRSLAALGYRRSPGTVNLTNP